MKRKFLLIALFLLCSFYPFSSILSQNVDSIKIDGQQSLDYVTKLEEQYEEILSLRKKIDKLISKNENLTNQLDKKNINYLEHQIDSLNNAILVLRDSISVAEMTNKELRITLDVKDKEIQSQNDSIVLLSNIKNQYLQSKVVEVNTYISQPYSELSDSIYTNFIKNLSPLSSMDKIVKALLSKLKLSQSYFLEYKDVVNNLYDKTYSKQFSIELDCRLDSLITLSYPTQINELKKIKEIIDSYPIAISQFQFIVKAIRDQVDYMRVEMPSTNEIEDANIAAKMVLDNNKIRLERSYKYSISKVPRLKNQYDNYIEIISVNSLSKDAVLIEEEILSLPNN